jgi:hypothetical protein
MTAFSIHVVCCLVARSIVAAIEQIQCFQCAYFNERKSCFKSQRFRSQLHPKLRYRKTWRPAVTLWLRFWETEVNTCTYLPTFLCKENVARVDWCIVYFWWR